MSPGSGLVAHRRPGRRHPRRRGVAKVRLPKGDWNLYADVGDDEVTMAAHQAVPLTDGLVGLTG